MTNLDMESLLTPCCADGREAHVSTAACLGASGDSARCESEEVPSPGAPTASASLVRPRPVLSSLRVPILNCLSPGGSICSFTAAPRPAHVEHSRKNPSAGARFRAPRLRRETLGIEEEKRRCREDSVWAYC